MLCNYVINILVTILSFEIYPPKNNVHNQDDNHDDNKVPITIFFLN
jgi:hypothetical protein